MMSIHNTLVNGKKTSASPATELYSHKEKRHMIETIEYIIDNKYNATLYYLLIGSMILFSIL